jgi:hypothetical protein
MASPGFLMTVLAFVAVIGPLVFVHEMGHYLVARWCGVRADVFSIGFGPEILGWKDRRGTRWRIAALPLGGYVKFAGDMGVASQTDPAWLTLPAAERAQSFPAKSVWQRMAIVAAGPVINLLFAVLILASLAMTYGTPVSEPVIGRVAAGSAAEKAGLKPGDRIVRIMDREIDDFRDISAIVSLRPGEVLSYEIMRNGRSFDLDIAAGQRIEKDRFGNIYRIGLLGVGSSTVKLKPVSLLEAPAVGVKQAIDVTRTGLDGMGQIIQRLEPDTIRSYVKLRAGDQRDQPIPRKAWIRRSVICTRPSCSDVQIRDNGGDLIIEVKENPVINRIVLEGNKRLKEDKIQARDQGRAAPDLHPVQGARRRARIIELYRGRAAFAATVEPKMVMLDQNRVDIVFEITEGPKVQGPPDQHHRQREVLKDGSCAAKWPPSRPGSPGLQLGHQL